MLVLCLIMFSSILSQHKHQDRDNASKSEEHKTCAGNEKFQKSEPSDHKNISDTNIKRIKLDNDDSTLDLVNCKYEVDVKNEFQMECKPPKSESAESKSLIEVPLLSDRSCTSLRRSRHTSFVSKSPLRQVNCLSFKFVFANASCALLGCSDHSFELQYHLYKF